MRGSHLGGTDMVNSFRDDSVVSVETLEDDFMLRTVERNLDSHRQTEDKKQKRNLANAFHRVSPVHLFHYRNGKAYLFPRKCVVFAGKRLSLLI